MLNPYQGPFEDCQPTPPDPIHQHKDGQWFFFDETWCDEYGPFESEERARKRLEQYGHWLDTGEVPL